MMDSIPKLMPIWHDLALQGCVRSNKENASFSNLKLPDHGGIGADVKNNGDGLVCEVTKHHKSQINFAAECCALPFLPLRKVPNMVDPCIEPLKKEEKDFFKFRLKLNYVRSAALRKTFSSHLKTLRQEIKNMYKTGDCRNTTIKVPKSVAELAECLPKRVIIPTFNVAYAGGNLATCKYSSNLNLLHPSYEVTSKLCITPIQEQSDGHFEPILSDQVSVSLKDEPILQIESTLNEFCCIRQKNSFHLLNVDNFKTTSKTIDKSVLYHIAACSYNPMEILYVYEKGMLKLRNMEVCKTIWSVQDYTCHDPTLFYPTWRCGFGSHPFSALCTNEKYFSSFDIRTKGDMKKLFSVQQSPSCDVSEQLVSLKQLSRNPFQHFLASSHHLIICDERYPMRPVMYWNHTLQDYPVYCEVTNLENSTNSVVVIGTQASRELSAFLIDSPQTHVQPFSLGPPLMLSSPSDCIDSLKLHCYSVNETFSSRLSYPLSGVCILSPSQKNTFTVFQSTSVSDIFYQNFKETFSNTVERTYRVGAGCVLMPPEFFLPHLKDWISSGDPLEAGEPVEESFSNLLISVAETLVLPKEISTTCSACRLNNASDVKALAISEVCPTCHLDSAKSQHFCEAMTVSTAVVGPASEEPSFLKCDVAYLSQFQDKYSKNMLSIWLEPDDVNGMYQLSQTAEIYLDSCPQSLNSNISYQESDYLTQDENISINVNPQPVIESSCLDFADDTQDYSQVVPPSQEARSLIGETLLTPAKTKLNLSKIKRLSTAGF